MSLLSSTVDDTHETFELPEDYLPTESDAIVGWARQHYHHQGNKKLRDVVYQFVPQYMNVRSKTEKGNVISDIIAKLRRESPSGAGLVRQDPKTKRWSYIGTEKAKDKIGHALRKASQDYRKQCAVGTYPHPCWNDTLPHLTSSSSFGVVDCTTTATPSTASSESDYEDQEEETNANNWYAHPHQASLDQHRYGGESYYSNQHPYHPQFQSMMYYDQHPSMQQPYSEAYPPFWPDPVAASYYQHHCGHYGSGAHYPAYPPQPTHQSGLDYYNLSNKHAPTTPYSESVAKTT